MAPGGAAAGTLPPPPPCAPPPPLPFPPLAPGHPVRERAAFWSRTPGRPLFHARPLEQSHQRARGKAPGPRPRWLGLWALLCWARLPAGAALGGRTGECGGHALPCPWPSSVLEAWGAHSPPQPLTCGPRCPTRDRSLGAPCALLTRGPDPPGALTPQALSGCTPGGRGPAVSVSGCCLRMSRAEPAPGADSAGLLGGWGVGCPLSSNDTRMQPAQGCLAVRGPSWFRVRFRFVFWFWGIVGVSIGLR